MYWFTLVFIISSLFVLNIDLLYFLLFPVYSYIIIVVCEWFNIINKLYYCYYFLFSIFYNKVLYVFYNKNNKNNNKSYLIQIFLCMSVVNWHSRICRSALFYASFKVCADRGVSTASKNIVVLVRTSWGITLFWGRRSFYGIMQTPRSLYLSWIILLLC